MTTEIYGSQKKYGIVKVKTRPMKVKLFVFLDILVRIFYHKFQTL